MKWCLPAFGLMILITSPAGASGIDACHKQCMKWKGQAYSDCRARCRTTSDNRAVSRIPASTTAAWAAALDSGKKKKRKTWRDRF